MTLTEDRLTPVMHELNEWARSECDHSMFRIYGDDRRGYERACLLDARFVIDRLAEDDVFDATKAYIQGRTMAASLSAAVIRQRIGFDS